MFMNVFEPVTLLSTLASHTSRIGLGGTVSTSFTEPYNVARQFAFAVGTRVTSRPPHRSVRAACPHTAPTSGV